MSGKLGRSILKLKFRLCRVETLLQILARQLRAIMNIYAKFREKTVLAELSIPDQDVLCLKVPN